MASPKKWPRFHAVPRIKRLRQLEEEAQTEANYLAGRSTKTKEILRLFRIFLEFFRGMRALHTIGPAVTVFGSARFKKEDHPYYQLGREVGKALAHEGFTVMTGGGPGIMEAVNRGAFETGGISVGCCIRLPHEQLPNSYLHKAVTFSYFFARKVMLIKYSYAFIILPGGFGTLDEMMEAITLIQTGKLYDFPVILMGKDYWQGHLEWVQKQMVQQGTVTAEELNFIHLTDRPEEAIEIIRKTIQGLKLTLIPIQSLGD